jgi:hypothetical protein
MPFMTLIFLWSKQSTCGYLKVIVECRVYLVDEQPEVLAALKVDHELLNYTVKKRLAVFPSPAGVSLTKLSLTGKIR